MAIQTPEQAGTERQGRVAPIFLSHEPRLDEPDLFSYSQAFYAKHKEGNVLPYDFGMVSALWQEGSEGEWHEAIAFDARGDDGYVWELCYALEPGAQQVARVQSTEQGSRAVFARTDRQGGLIDVFQMDAWEISGLERRLIERLESLEVQAKMQEIYDRRKSMRLGLVKLVNERAADNVRFASILGIDLAKVTPPKAIDGQIEAQHRQIESTGFSPLMVFNPAWFDRFAA